MLDRLDSIYLWSDVKKFQFQIQTGTSSPAMFLKAQILSLTTITSQIDTNNLVYWLLKCNTSSIRADKIIYNEFKIYNTDLINPDSGKFREID